ncbi:MAG: cytochrome b/b6 domain-containing protein [Xanthobacteraceae bacterium]|jgi:cytochrome b subunit of formate dehydrogenase/nitrate/TMAO reductase-like tetraheme cytochrome c subunit
MRAGKLVLSAAALTMILVGAQAASAQDAAKLDNATCLGCHGVQGLATPSADGHMRSLYVPADQFANSVHGETLRCIDCHTTITELPHKNLPATLAERDRQRLAINNNCGNCHAKAWQSYTETYHGQVAVLGYADAATCFDCHGSHAIRRASDPTSSVSPANLLKTCQNCHQDATPGFATFEAHATTDDFAHYPYVWIASKFVNIAVGGVLWFFWFHSALWFYRELRDRQKRKLRPHVRTDALPRGPGPYYQRWSAMWRWVHLIFAVSIIVLVMTGLPLHYPNASWAPPLERAMGGPEIAGLVHRVAAVIMIAVFAGHIVYAGIHIARNWSTFKVFGPYSLMPNWQDAADFVAMFKWFFGRGPRPMFDHWNYQQKVDYWAPFWGIAMLAATGAMLWFKTLTAAYLPGWTFNVATVAHGDEALLAAAYLFTVHYFVNHWRPDKFPLDIVIFTGSMPLEEFKREYAVEYARLVKTGELQQHLVDAPARPLTLSAEIIGFSLVAVGLALLVMMAIGFSGSLGG